MAKGTLTKTDSELVEWTQNFSSLITLSPLLYGLTALLASEYATVSSGFVSAYQTAVNPPTRTKVTIEAKNDARTLLKTKASFLIKLIEGTASVTDAQKLALGIDVRDNVPTPKPAPVLSPIILVKGVNSRTVSIRLQDRENPERRGKPVDVAAASVFTFVGETPSDDIADWKFEGNLTRVSTSISFPLTVPAFAKVWFSARWYNSRGVTGPNTPPVGTNLGAGLSQAA